MYHTTATEEQKKETIQKHEDLENFQVITKSYVIVRISEVDLKG